MAEKAKSPAGEQGLMIQNKDTYSYRIIASIKQLFKSGRKLTAIEINEITHSNDARKVISTLRADGWNIQDIRFPDNRKLYWLVEPDRQLPLFKDKEVINE